MTKEVRPLPDHLRRPFLFGIGLGYLVGVFLLALGIGIHSGYELAFGIAFLVLSTFNVVTYRLRTRA